MNPRHTAAPSDITVSVVLPVKDDAPALRRCLNAIASQSRAPDEIVVVDNASTDSSAHVARLAGARVVSCDRAGIPEASAHGYDCATGDIILRLDADCVPGPDWVQTVVDAFTRRPDVDAFSGGAVFLDGPAWLRRPLSMAYLVSYAVVSASALGHLPLFGSNLAFRRSAWQRTRSRIHRHDGGLHDDLDLAFHLGERFRIRYLPGPVMGMSMRPFSSLSAFLRRIAAGFRTVVVHWPRDFPPLRWTRIALLRLRIRPAPRTADGSAG